MRSLAVVPARLHPTVQATTLVRIKKGVRTARPKTVDAYIAAAPGHLRAKLKELRAIIKQTVPEAEEKIGYGMPFYKCHGALAYFQLSKNHLGLYIPPPVIQLHKKYLRHYETSKATIRFPLHGRLPHGLIKKMIRARRELNEEPPGR